MGGFAPTVPSFMAQYDLAFQVSPILLKGGIASSVQGGLMPIISLTGGPTNSAADAFATYLPLNGSTLISQAIGSYPFANQAVAANATIQQPLTLSMLMIAPVNQAGGYLSKMHTFSALQKALAQHNAAGGLYVVATPAFIYNDLIMTQMIDVSSEIQTDGDGPKQVQIEYQIDFVQPIVTQQEADAQLGALLQRITNGSKITGTPKWSGNPASSPANLPGVAGALGNVVNALSAFGGAP